MNLDQLIAKVRADEPETAAVEQAAARVRGRLFPKTETAAPTGAIRSCADFTALLPTYLAGSLDAGRKMLFEVHTRECVACRKALDEARQGVRHVIAFRPRKSAVPQYAGWAIAASALLVAGGATYWGFEQYPALGGGPRATVDSIEGAVYKVARDALTPLAPGAELTENDTVRTAKNSTAVLRLNDGSQIELNQRAQISVTRSWSGSTIHLGMGSIIVQAAKQRRGTLQVATSDCNISVKGTVFSVDAGTKGSRVAVVEGTVWVDQGKKHDVLHRGDETATAPDMGPVPIRQEFEWSRNSAQYLALLGEFSELKRRIAAIPAPGLRYESKLLGHLPADIAVVVAIPNVGNTLQQASDIFHERLQQSDTLAAWWNRVPSNQRTGVEKTIQALETASQYLGNEIVIAARFDGAQKTSPIVLAELTKPGFDGFIHSQMPANFSGLPAMRFDNGLFEAAENAADLDAVTASGDFPQTPLYRKLAPAYQQGAGWLFGADLAHTSLALPGIADARFLTAESRTWAGNTENRASVTFSGDRHGVASWLSAPGPMGSLEFVSPDAGFAASMLLKSPALIADDLTGMMSKASGDKAPISLDTEFATDLAGAFGGEITVAMDGPLFPMPSWKIAAEVYYPDRLQSALSKLVAAVNAKTDHLEKTGELKLSQSVLDNRIFYSLKFDKLPWEAHWTYIDGYWVAAANRELLVRSIQNRQLGYTLPKSNAFRSQLPHDSSANFSAVIYHNLGQTLAPLIQQSDTPGVICFWAAPDRIDVATMGNLFGIKLESLLAMQGASPLKLLGNSFGARARQ